MDNRIATLETDILDRAHSGVVTNDQLAVIVDAGESHLVSAALHNLLAHRLVTRLDDGSITAS